MELPIRQTEFGEVSIPKLKRRPVIEEIIPHSPEAKAAEARHRLEVFRSRQKKVFAHRSWTTGRRLGLVASRGQIFVLNRTNQKTDQLLALLHIFYGNLDLKGRVHVLLHDSWAEIDRSTGSSIKGPISCEPDWDSESWPISRGVFIQICCPPSTSFPLLWDPPFLSPPKYLPRVTWFGKVEEMFFYFCAYEMRRYWQMKNHKNAIKLTELLQVTTWLEASLYAISQLGRYQHDLGNPHRI